LQRFDQSTSLEQIRRHSGAPQASPESRTADESRIVSLCGSGLPAIGVPLRIQTLLPNPAMTGVSIRAAAKAREPEFAPPPGPLRRMVG
jgi:hypothetical protein